MAWAAGSTDVLGAQSEPTTLPTPRSPVLATAIAASIPGGGHVYAGERTRGRVIGSVFVGGFLVFWSGWAAGDDCFRPHCDPAGPRRRELLGTGISAGAYLVSLVDAPLAARRQNRANASAPRSPTPTLTVASDGAVGIGVRIPLAH